MNLWSIVLFAQLAFFGLPFLASLIASCRERGEDSRFAGAKVAFRS